MKSTTHASSQIEARLRSKLTSQAVNDPEFHQLLRASAEAIRAQAEKAPNEATIESAFERHLFSILRSIGFDYSPVKETKVSGTVLRQSGRTDSRFSDVVIEFKHRSEMNSNAKIDHHLKQLCDYLEALRPEMTSDQVGFLTDGVRFVRVVLTTDGKQSISAPAPIDGDGLAVICRTLIAAKASALNADNLVRDFCGSVDQGYIFATARELYAAVVANATLKSEMLRSEWESLFRLAHEDTSQQRRIEQRRAALEEIFGFDIDYSALEYLCLFSLHTAYAIVIKLVSYKVVSETVFGTTLMDYKALLAADDATIQAFCASLEEGELFRQVGILNLLEGDFFSWYADAGQWNGGIATSVRSVLQVLSRYEDARNVFQADRAVDLFRHLYEAAIPQVVRASFGEFYTPLWLAQHVLAKSGYKPGERVLDPCCGSGTFLIAALQKKRGEIDLDDKPAAIAELLNTVVGIDLNPLAVLTARIHYFIYICDLVSETRSIVIPVFLGDASNVPTIEIRNKKRFLRYELDTLRHPLQILLPMSVVEDRDTLFRLMNEFEVLLSQKDYAAARTLIQDFCRERKLSTEETDSLVAITDQIADLERAQWNGIWARIIANFASTVAIGKFHRVIGNPPWIDWKSLPAGYRETVKKLCIDRGLFSGAGRTGGINLNVCALIAHVSATNWLANKGRLSFLMPRELAVQPSYEGWRRSVGGVDCRIVEFYDWSDAGHPFEPVREDFMTFGIRKGGPAGTDVKVVAYSKATPRSKPWLWETLEEAETKLVATERHAEAIIPGSSAFTFADTQEQLAEFELIAGTSSYIGREGIEFYPQELVMFRYLGPGPRKGTVMVENFQGTKSKFRIPKQKLLLESKHLYPLVKGPNILPYAHDENDLLVAFPYTAADPHRPIPRATLRKESPLLLAYFLKFEAQMSAQTAYSDSIRAEGEFYGLARTGPYSFATNYVGFRDNTKWSACVLQDREMPWGERKRYLFQNHAVSMCEDANRSFITEDEAHYIAAILNSDVTSRFILASSDNRSFKIRPPIYLPKFDPASKTHQALVALSRSAHLDPSKRAAAATKGTQLYLRICASR